MRSSHAGSYFNLHRTHRDQNQLLHAVCLVVGDPEKRSSVRRFVLNKLPGFTYYGILPAVMRFRHAGDYGHLVPTHRHYNQHLHVTFLVVAEPETPSSVRRSPRKLHMFTNICIALAVMRLSHAVDFGHLAHTHRD